MNTTKREKTIKELFIGECWEYLRDNFHKFNETNKIKIALTLAQKDMPQEIQGNMNHVVRELVPIQKQYHDELSNTPVNRIAEFEIGSLDP